MIQARMSQNDPRLYNVNRDVAHNGGEILKMVFQRLRDRRWPELEEVLDEQLVTDLALSEAVQTLARFLEVSYTEPRLSMEKALASAGWFETLPAAQVAVMATLGAVMMGVHFAGIREATIAGDGPLMGIKDVARCGYMCAECLATGKTHENSP